MAELNDAKGILESRTIWGALIAVLSTGAAATLHITIPAAEQSQIVDLILQCVSLVGSALAIYGRIAATKTIGGKP